MVIKNNDMIVFGLFKAFLKLSLGWFGLMVLFQNLLEKEIFELFMNAMPSKFAMWMGGLYLTFIVAKKGVELYHFFEMKRMERKEKRKELKDK